MSPLSASYNETLNVVLGLWTDTLLTDGRSAVVAVADKSTLARDRPSLPIPNCRPAAPNQIRPETCLFISRIIFLDYHQYHEGTARLLYPPAQCFAQKGA